MNRGQQAQESIITDMDSPPVLKLAEHVLSSVRLAVEDVVVRNRHLTIDCDRMNEYPERHH